MPGIFDHAAHLETACRRVEHFPDGRHARGKALVRIGIDLDDDGLPGTQRAEVALGQIDDHPQMRRVGNHEQRVRRIGTHFHARIDAKFGHDAAQPRTQHVAGRAGFARGRVEIAQTQFAAAVFCFGLTQIALRVFHVLARDDPRGERFFGARIGSLLEPKIRARFGDIGGGGREFRGVHSHEGLTRHHAVAGLDEDARDAAGDRRADSGRMVFVVCHPRAQGIDQRLGQGFARLDLDEIQLRRAGGKMQFTRIELRRRGRLRFRIRAMRRQPRDHHAAAAPTSATASAMNATLRIFTFVRIKKFRPVGRPTGRQSRPGWPLSQQQ